MKPNPDPSATPVHQTLHPAGWPQPRGYANGIAARGTLVVTGGIIGWDQTGRLADGGLVGQVRLALSNIVDVLAEAGATPQMIVRMTWYVVDMADYRASLKNLGAVYREVIGRHYPAMALVEVKSLVETDAVVEIEATAVIPD